MKILVSGDFCPCSRISRLIEERQYDKIFHDVRSIIGLADYSIVNFECPVVERKEARPIKKMGPNLCCTFNAVEAISYAGFDCVTLANNHFADFGDIGIEDTLKACDHYRIDVVGGGRNSEEASKILYKEIDGITVAIINCCEHEFSIVGDEKVNANMNKNLGGSNPLNPIKQYYSICEAKQHADKILVVVHGGHEHFQLPSPRMKELYRFFIDAGADLVINHHQHCYSGYERYKKGLIFYGLGNFCFDSISGSIRDSIWNYGYFVIIEFTNDVMLFEIYPYIQCNDNPEIKFLYGKEKNYFDSMIEKLNNIIQNDDRLISEYKIFINKKAKKYISCIEPYSNRYLNALYVRGLLPSFITKKKLLLIKNYILCESHLDCLANSIKYLEHRVFHK